MILCCTHISGGAQSLISDSIDVTHYDIHLTRVDFAQKEIQAIAEVYITPAQASLSGICLELLKLQVDSVFAGSTVIFPYQYNDTLLRFNLPTPLLAGDTLPIRIHYQGKPHVESYNWGGFHFQGTEYAFNLGIAIADIPHNYGKVWFPCVDDFRDRATYTTRVTVDNGYMAICGGELMSIIPETGGKQTFVWHLDKTIPTYLASVAIADYVALIDTFQGMNGPIPTGIYVRPLDSLKAVQSFANLHQITAVFEQLFGPYPWNRIGFVAAPKGAMEHATNITYPRNFINGNLSYEYLIAHELSHMWFGNLVTCDHAGDMWLNEGWASFCEFIYREGLYGVADRKSYVRKKLRNILQNLHVEDGYLPLTNMPLNLTYGTTVYTKGACVVHSLRGYMGDSLFFPAVRAYLDTFAFKHASSQDLRDALSYHSGISLDDFFDAWIDRPGFLHFRVDSFRVMPMPQPPLFNIEVSLRQTTKGPAQVSLQNRLELLFMDENWNQYETMVTFDGPVDQVIVEVPFIPTVVFADPREKLCDAITEEFRTLKSPGKSIFTESMIEVDVLNLPDSAAIQASHHWVPPDPLDQPVQGFRISDYRFWSVKGIFPPGFKAQGRFYYSRFTNLDGGIILNQKDSVVLMYRSGPGLSWQEIITSMQGVTYQGWLLIDSLMPGEYTLGVWDHQHMGTGQNRANQLFQVFPNPSRDRFHFRAVAPFMEGYLVQIIGGNGQVVARQNWETSSGEWIWNAGNNPSGTYHVEVLDTSGRRLYSTSLVKI